MFVSRILAIKTFLSRPGKSSDYPRLLVSSNLPKTDYGMRTTRPIGGAFRS